MCFTTSQNKKAEAIAKKYGRKTDIVEALREILVEKEAEEMEKNGTAKIFQTRIAEGMYFSPAYEEPYNIIVIGSDQLQIMQWGLIPRKTTLAKRDLYNKKNLYKNAQAENMFTKWPWDTVNKNRCILPVTGFFESHHNPDGTKQPYYIERKDKEIFSIAGLFDVWKHPETGEEFKTFVMLTVPATPKMKKIHNGGEHPYRMPLILSEELTCIWLEPTIDKQSEIEKILVTPDIDSEIVAWPVRKGFNYGNPYDSSIIERVPVQKEFEL